MSWTKLLGEQLTHLQTTLDISSDELALVLQTDRKTVHRWLARSTFPQQANRERLDALEGLVQRLEETFTGSDGPAIWLHSPSGYFGGLRPIDALLRGRIDAVYAALEALDAGAFV